MRELALYTYNQIEKYQHTLLDKMMNQYHNGLSFMNYACQPFWFYDQQYPTTYFQQVQQTAPTEECFPFLIQPKQNVILYSGSEDRQPESPKKPKKSRRKSLNDLTEDDSLKNIRYTESTKKKAPKVDQADQKEGRNAISNLLRTFFRRLHFRLNKDIQLFQKIIDRHHLSVSVIEFLSWFQNNKVDFRNYIRWASVKRLFSSENQQFCKIMRVLLQDFMTREAVNCFLTSRKTKRDAMVHNLSAIRSVNHEINEVSSEQVE